MSAQEDARLADLVARMCAIAWDEGYQTCCGDFDIAARSEARSPNPYRPTPHGSEAS